MINCNIMKSTVIAAAMVALAATVVPVQAQDGRGPEGDVLPNSQGSDRLDVIVVLDERFGRGRGAANRAEAANIARGLGVNPHHVWGHALFGFAARVPQGRLEALRNDPRVAYIEFDEVNTIPTPRHNAQKPRRCADDPSGPGCGGGGDDPTPPDPGMDELPWGVDRIGAFGLENTGAGIHVYIIDSGISVDHEDLHLGSSYAAVNCVPSKKCLADWDDDNGHGSHVAGTVGALANGFGVIGVAPDVTLHAVKVLDKRGSAFTSEIIDGINFVVADKPANEVVVANISIGGSGSKTGICGDGTWTGNNAYQQTMCTAANAGVIFAVAAGNEGVDAVSRRPASYDDTSIAVSATGQTADVPPDDGWPEWSNWGQGAADWTLNNSAPVAIAAPGMGVLSTWKNGGYNTISGTSMAAPHVAGAIALWLAANPGQTVSYQAFLDARSALLDDAEPTSVGDNFTITGGNVHEEDFLDVRTFNIIP